MDLHPDWTTEDFCDELERAFGGFVAVTDGADPEVEVATCPGWRLADCWTTAARRTGGAPRWCAG
jgi:hypothetical protein